jgi:predicted ester cyclase
MSTEENKRVVLRLFNEVMNNRNLSIINEVFDERSIHHGFTYPVVGPAGFRELLSQFFVGFPDLNLKVEKAVAENDFVATRGTWTGRHEGDFMGISSTGKSVKVGYMDMWRMENGKCVENWVQMDIAGLMQQLGAMEPAAAGI